jgi:hypothetical protein
MTRRLVQSPWTVGLTALSRLITGLVRQLLQRAPWRGVGGSRAPIQDGNFSRTALGIRALTAYAWATAEPKLRDTRVRELLALQRADGGWAQTPYLQSDAFATGQVLYALRQLGVPARTPPSSGARCMWGAPRPRTARGTS